VLLRYPRKTENTKSKFFNRPEYGERAVAPVPTTGHDVTATNSQQVIKFWLNSTKPKNHYAAFHRKFHAGKVSEKSSGYKS